MYGDSVGQDDKGHPFLFSASGLEGLVLRSRPIQVTSEEQMASLGRPPLTEEQSSGILTVSLEWASRMGTGNKRKPVSRKYQREHRLGS